MPPSKNWKNVERQSAKMLGAKRVPNQGVRAMDIDHPWLHPEHKQRPAVPEWWTKALTAWLACPPEKIPCVIFAHAPGQGRPIKRYLILSLDDHRVQHIFHAEREYGLQTPAPTQEL